MSENEEELRKIRVQIDSIIKQVEKHTLSDKAMYYCYTREIALVRTKLQEAKMWAGKCLEQDGSPLPKAWRDEASL